jgi:hypothetical protein
LVSCSNNSNDEHEKPVKIIFLHHSVGYNVWEGKHNLAGKFFHGLKRVAVKEYLNEYNQKNAKAYLIDEQVFPKDKPYGWNNYPFDYYNIWVKHAGNKPFDEEPTLEMLTKEYQLIVWKHCFPVSDAMEDTGKPDINSSEKRMENYKLQYNALRDKMHQFPSVKFIVWTGAAQTKSQTTEAEAKRAYLFFEWVKNEWDIPNDNIFIWDFRSLETNGGLYLTDDNALNPSNSHPNQAFSEKAAQLFVSRLTDVIESGGTKTNNKGLIVN